MVVGGNEIASYSNYGKKLLEIRNFKSTRPAAWPIETTIQTDLTSQAQKLYSAAQSNVRLDMMDENNKTRAKEYVSIRQRSVGGAEANIVNSWHVVVRNYNLLDLYRWGVKPDDAILMINPTISDAEKQRILDAANIIERSVVGDLPYHQDLLSPSIEEQFEEVKEISRQIPALAAAGGQHIVSGAWISIPPGYVGVILSIAVDAQQIMLDLAGGTGPYSCCFLYISRDDLDNYVRLDAAAMPSTLTGAAGTNDFSMRMYIPVTKKFQVQIVNNHALSPVVAGLRVRIKYGL
ncbi:MAG TPA: hypothetical protein PLP05_09385, partial [Sedimentisphaerales bacterium]|nr:hypothetical protein [Sedimentisphaerales bacterium]